jgi:hypothetical protein
MSDYVSGLLRKIIWQRREAFYDAAMKRGIVHPRQVAELMQLHKERDDEQDARERDEAAADEATS